MTITDEAVQAAWEAFDAKGGYSMPEKLRSALTAAAPFLQGVKAEPWGWVIPRGGSKKPIILEASKFDQASAAAEADIHDFGYFPIYAQPVSSPSPRAQALEEAARVAEQFSNNDWIAHDIRTGVFPKQSYSGIAIAAAIRALSSQPVADEWLPIETAPKDGTEFLGHDASTKTTHVTFVNSNGYFHDPDSHYYSEAPEFKPTHWRPFPTPPEAQG